MQSVTYTRHANELSGYELLSPDPNLGFRHLLLLRAPP